MNTPTMLRTAHRAPAAAHAPRPGGVLPFPALVSTIRVEVRDGVVKLSGHARDASLVPVVARLVRAVEGVVDVAFELTATAPHSEAGHPSPASSHSSPA